VVKHQSSGLNQEFKVLTKGVYTIIIKNSIIKTVSVIKDEHLKLYKKFGGFEVEKKFDVYGTLNNDFIITRWDVSQISKFFRKAFLAG